jgi:hypothetical protein
MKPGALAAVVLGVAILAGAAVFYIGGSGSSSSPPPTSSSSLSSSSSSPSTGATTTGISVTTASASTVTSSEPNDLQLQLRTNATDLQHGGGVEISVSEYNTARAVENVSAANDWPLMGLSDGACGHMAYPFGVAVFQGYYTAGNVSSGQPLQIHPVVPCPMLIRLVTGYLFSPLNDSAVILPGSSNATTLMAVNVTAIGTFNDSLTPFSPGTYTVAAGDEWGGLTVLHFSVSNQGSGGVGMTTITATSTSSNGAGNSTSTTGTARMAVGTTTSSSAPTRSSSSSSSSSSASGGMMGMSPPARIVQPDADGP